MATSYLVVEVAEADVPSSSNGTSSYYVELSFRGRSKYTEITTRPVWNQMISFRMRDDEYDYHLPSPSDGLNLKAAVYSVDQTSRSEPILLGIAVVDSKDFDIHSSVLLWHDLMSVSSDDPEPEVSRLGPVAGVNQGKLKLRVFYSAAYDRSRLEIEDGSSLGHQTTDGADYVMEIFNQALEPAVLFSSKDSTGASSRALRRIEPSFERGKVVEAMQFLFVVVVRARGLPDVDAYGGLDPFVEVNFGDSKRFTTFVMGDTNPEWNTTFVFALPSWKIKLSRTTGVDVVVKDNDLLRHDFVGKVYFDFKDIQTRHPEGAQPEPTWHPLRDQHGMTLGKASLLLAIWIGSQADEAYRSAWESRYAPKVYENPRLWCLRVAILEVRGVVARADDEELFCKVCLEKQIRRTKPGDKIPSARYVWKEEEDDLVFIAAQPFFESNLQVYVIAASSSTSDSQDQRQQAEEVIGQFTIPLAEIKRLDAQAYGCLDPLDTQAPQWYEVDQGCVSGGNVSRMEIRLRTLLDGGYHIGHDPQGYLDDTRPAEVKLWEPPIGRLHLGILRAKGLKRQRRSSSTSELKPYCVAKYGDKWVRTRTILESSDPVFNEQYTWDVYDIATVLNVGVFDNCTVRDSNDDSEHHKIGKVRIRLSTLQTDRVYAHAYSLLTLTPSGAEETGDLHLALKISLTSSTSNMLRMYARPILPRMHHLQPLKHEQEDFFAETVGGSSDNKYGKLWLHAANILAHRLDRIVPPLRKEVVAYMCNVESCNNNSFSLRRSKANFLRLTAVIITSLRWFEGVLSWRNPLVTLLIHAMLVLALWFHGLVLPLLLVCVALVGVWNYRDRPRSPTHIDLVLSHVLAAHPDELDEEFDTYPSSRTDDVLRMRYDRLRSVAGRIQTVVGGVACQFEMIHSLLIWRDPTATAIFMPFLLIAAAVSWFLPYKKLLLAVAGFYIMRHPRLRTRTKTPSIFKNFFMRLPGKQDMLM